MQDLFDDLAMKFIKERVKQMMGKYGYTASDREDLEQEFALHLLNRLQRLKEPIEDRQGFFRHVISQHAIAMIRRREAEKRDHRRERSLSEKVNDDDGTSVEMARTIPADHARPRLDAAPRDRLGDWEQAQDVAAVMAKLPSDLRELCERLKVHSVAEVARRMGVPRRTLRNAIEELRRRFDEARLGDNLEK